LTQLCAPQLLSASYNTVDTAILVCILLMATTVCATCFNFCVSGHRLVDWVLPQLHGDRARCPMWEKHASGLRQPAAVFTYGLPPNQQPFRQSFELGSHARHCCQVTYTNTILSGLIDPLFQCCGVHIPLLIHSMRERTRSVSAVPQCMQGTSFTSTSMHH
jgi:hypothetical protein